MNQQRRKAIKNAVDKLGVAKHQVALECCNDVIYDTLMDIYGDVEYIYDQEEDYMENGIPENMQSGSRYEKAEAACDNLQEAIDSIYEAKESLENKQEIIKYINEAVEYLMQASV